MHWAGSTQTRITHPQMAKMPVLRAAGCSECVCNSGRLIPSARVQGDSSTNAMSTWPIVGDRRPFSGYFGAATPAWGLSLQYLGMLIF